MVGGPRKPRILCRNSPPSKRVLLLCVSGINKVRLELYGDRISKPRSLVIAIDKAIEDPSGASGKTLESIIVAMEGKLYVDWTTDVVIQKATRQTVSGLDDEELETEVVEENQES